MDIPDFVPSDNWKASPSGMAEMQMDILPNRDYYRDLVRYQTEQSSIASLWLAVINEGDTAVRDVRMEMTALVTSGVVNLRMIQPHIPSRLLTSTASVTLSTGQPPELVIGQQDGDEWAMHLRPARCARWSEHCGS